MKIITLTLNPAYDLHLYMDSLHPQRDNLATAARRDAGGKGVNLSRALVSVGLDVITYLLLPSECEREYLSALSRDGINPIYDLKRGFIRENINIHTEEGDTVIATDGTPITAEEVALVKGKILPLIDSDTYLVFSGGIPKDSDKAAILSLLSSARARGARLILDSRSLTREEIFSLSPYLIKPNADEAAILFGDRISGIRQVAFAASALFSAASGSIENLLITAGREGAILASGEGIFLARPPKIKAVSTVGAGDSTVAGFLAAEMKGLSTPERLRLATAFGTAACLEEGTRPPRAEKIAELYRCVKIEKI